MNAGGCQTGVTIIATNFSRGSRHLLRMRSTRQWSVLVFSVGLACGIGASAAEFSLTPSENQRVSAREVVIRANLDSSQRRGMVRAAVRIEAPPDVVFRMMTHCAEALEYVPHLRQCRVRDQAADESW